MIKYEGRCQKVFLGINGDKAELEIEVKNETGIPVNTYMSVEDGRLVITVERQRKDPDEPLPGFRRGPIKFEKVGNTKPDEPFGLMRRTLSGPSWYQDALDERCLQKRLERQGEENLDRVDALLRAKERVLTERSARFREIEEAILNTLRDLLPEQRCIYLDQIWEKLQERFDLLNDVANIENQIQEVKAQAERVKRLQSLSPDEREEFSRMVRRGSETVEALDKIEESRRLADS